MPEPSNKPQPILTPDESVDGSKTSATNAVLSEEEIRRHERLDISLGARLVPAGSDPGSRPEVRFSGKASVGPGGLEAIAVDLSEGGIGFITSVMLPRNAVFQVRVLAPPGAITTSLIETRVRVRRCQMVDHKPTFLIGTAFLEQSSVVRAKVTRARGLLSITGPEDSKPNNQAHTSKPDKPRSGISNSEKGAA